MERVLIYNGIRSADYGVAISGEGVWTKPSPVIERIQVPGRNGDILRWDGSYDNISITYRCGIRCDFPEKFNAFVAMLLADPGYHRLEDTYNPEHYRIGMLTDISEITPGRNNRWGTFTITFDCKPQNYLKVGENEITYSANSTLLNPTAYTAKPLLTVLGAGYYYIGTVRFMITTSSLGEIIIDTETEDCYSSTGLSRNAYIILDNYTMPTLPPGQTGIRVPSGGSIKIKPRWWAL